MNLTELVFSDAFSATLTWKIFRAARCLNVAASAHKYVDTTARASTTTTYRRSFALSDLIVLEIGRMDVILRVNGAEHVLSCSPTNTIGSRGSSVPFLIPAESSAIVWDTRRAVKYLRVFRHKWAGHKTFLAPAWVVAPAVLSCTPDISVLNHYGYDSAPNLVITFANGDTIDIRAGEIRVRGTVALYDRHHVDPPYTYLLGLTMYTSYLTIEDFRRYCPFLADELIPVE